MLVDFDFSIPYIYGMSCQTGHVFKCYGERIFTQSTMRAAVDSRVADELLFAMKNPKKVTRCKRAGSSWTGSFAAEHPSMLFTPFDQSEHSKESLGARAL